MKQYVLSILAIILAVSFSAFVTPGNKQKPLTVENEYYWYRLHTNGTIDAPAVNASGPTYTKTEALNITLDGCDDPQDDDICLVGSESSSLAENSTPPGPTMDNENRLYKIDQ
ncbi:MAG: hypothetical protein JNN00_06560 [Chitinophagaceae bacterium]|nr:hypothetical protein [Chitinophagaceae bacterium]